MRRKKINPNSFEAWAVSKAEQDEQIDLSKLWGCR